MLNSSLKNYGHYINPLNSELNPICHLLALLGAHPILHISRIRFKHVARVGEERGVYRVLGKPEGKRPMGRPRRRWVDNIRMDLQDVGYGYMDWIGLA